MSIPPLQPITIGEYKTGLQKDKKPFLIADEAFQTLENAYVWRSRVKKREGNRILGRLRRIFTDVAMGNSSATPWTFNIYTSLTVPISGPAEPNKEIEAGSVTITFNAVVFTDQGDGRITSDVNNYGWINYTNGNVTLIHNQGAGPFPVTISFNYFPTLPVMGIPQRDLSGINQEQTIFFDTKYAYVYVGTGFQEYIAGTQWTGSDSDLFVGANYRGATPSDRLFFVTNFVNNANNPIRYTDGATWTTLTPLVSATDSLFQARIIIPYYGRLLALNCWEGATGGGFGGAANIFNRCRFSQIGNPVAADAWRSDQFGKGGFIDAPTNEMITSAIFIKNTLVVFFEKSTWQLRYVGEYGLPFIWERVAADLGSESTLSSIYFDQGLLTVGDRGIIKADATGLDRIDRIIPDQIFAVRNLDNGVKRVVGVRDYKRELVFWSYPDQEFQAKFPNRIIVYNYRNNTFALFRDNVTAFGLYNSQDAITWDSLDVFWDDYNTYWEDPDNQEVFEYVVSGNQEGFIHLFGYSTQNEPSLTIRAVAIVAGITRFTIPNHGLITGDFIYVTGMLFLDDTTHLPDPNTLDNFIYKIKVVDANTVSIAKYDGTNYVEDFAWAPQTNATYVGDGRASLLPVMNITTKDFNPYSTDGNQLKISYIDFLTDVTQDSSVTINMYCNTSEAFSWNLPVGNINVETNLTPPYYAAGSDITWHRFYATAVGQFIRVNITYNDELMNVLPTHQSDFVLNAMTLWTRRAGKQVF